MRYLLPVLLLASLGLAQIFGPAGVPLTWDFGIATFNADSIAADKFTSPSATSNLSFTSSAAADSLVWVQTQAAGDNDMVFKFVEDDGTRHSFRWDDGSNKWIFLEGLEVAGGFNTGPVSINYGQLYLGAGFINPNSAGAGTLQLGATGDRDINYLNGRLQTNVITVATMTVMGAHDGWMYTMTANDTLKCPVTPLAGEVLECKFTNAAGGLLFGNGKTIDGASEVAASENDNIRIVYNGTSGEWEIR